MPPTRAARWITVSGLASRSNATAAVGRRRSYSLLLGLSASAQPRARNAAITEEPRNPLPPVTSTRWLSQTLMTGALFHSLRAGLEQRHHAGIPPMPAGTLLRHDLAAHAGGRQARGRRIGVNHQADQLLEGHPGLPPEFLPRPGRVGDEVLDVDRPEVSRFDFDIPAPIEADIPECLFHKLLHRVTLSRPEDIIVRTLLLKHQPHAFHILRRVSPVAPGVEVTQVQVLLPPAQDGRDRPRDLPRDERFSPAGALVVEQDPVAREEIIASPVGDHHPMRIDLRGGIGALRAKRAPLALGCGCVAKHFARGRLIDA